MANTGRPNVLWLLCDQQPWNALGCYGNLDVRTPNIDRLALQGCRFSRCYTQHLLSGRCAASVLAGRYPARLGADVTGPLHLVLPRALRDCGYRSGAFGAIPVMADSFDVVDAAAASEGQTSAHLATCKSLEFLGQQAAQPFFCAVGFEASATEPNVPRQYLDLYNPRTLAPLHPPLLSPGALPEQQQSLTHAYYATLSEIDACCGQLLQELERMRLAENTVVVFAGMCGLHIEPSAVGRSGEAIPEATVRVPLIIRGPADAVQAGVVCESIVEQIDLAPTLLQLLGVPVPEGVQGRSFRAVLRGESHQHRDSALTELPDRVALHTEHFQYSVRHDGRELIYDMGEPSGPLRNVSVDIRYRGALVEHRHRLITRLIQANYAAV